MTTYFERSTLQSSNLSTLKSSCSTEQFQHFKKFTQRWLITFPCIYQHMIQTGLASVSRLPAPVAALLDGVTASSPWSWARFWPWNNIFDSKTYILKQLWWRFECLEQ